MNKIKTIGVYLRVSTGNQKTDSQKREVLEYCKRRFPEIQTVIFEDVASGSKTARIELERLLQGVRAGKIDVVTCYKLDRLGRSLSHLAQIIDELTLLNVPLICTSQGIDTSSDNPVGRLQLNVLSAVAEFEKGIIKERVNAGLKAAKERGVRLGRPCVTDKKRLEVVERLEKGENFREIAKSTGLSLGMISKIKQTIK